MKKVVSLVLVIALFAVIATVSFAGCNLFKSISLDEAKANLEGAGYTVTVMTGKEFVESDRETYTIMESELENYLYAVKGSDEIHMFFFYTINDAERNYDFISDSKLLEGQKNELVYLATKQARKDAKV